MSVTSALKRREGATQALSASLKALEGQRARQAGITQCLDAGLSVAEIAALMGVSRQRIHQLLDSDVKSV